MSRSVEVFREEVGAPRGGEQDVIRVTVRYDHRQGYDLCGTVVRESDGLIFQSLFTGISERISERVQLERAGRFSAKKLKAIAASMNSDEKKVVVELMASALREELASRIETGESY